MIVKNCLLKRFRRAQLRFQFRGLFVAQTVMTAKIKFGVSIKPKRKPKRSIKLKKKK